MGNVVTIGADPEFFIVDKLGQAVVSCGKFGGTKEKPIRLSESLAPRFTVQEDNVMVEFNIPPSKTMNGFVQAIQQATSVLNDKVQKMGYVISAQCEMLFPRRLLQTPQARTFGCSPDFNAHDAGNEFAKVSPNQLVEGDNEWRFAGGHIHVGYDSPVPLFVAASFADLFIGLRSLYAEAQKKRRTLYGQPGRYRPTSYGLEYRTPSNYWLFDHSAMCDISSSAILFGTFMQDTKLDRIRQIYQGTPWDSVREAISNGDATQGSQIRNWLASEYSMEV